MIKQGLEFAEKYDLTKSEMKVLIKLLDKEKLITELANEFGETKVSLHNILMRLRLKGLVEIKSKGQYGTISYGITDLVPV